jgi:putative ABC transport system permease protein
LAGFWRHDVKRLIAMMRARRLDAQLSDELEFHRDMLIEKYVREGRSRKDAELEAARQLGNVPAVREEHRDQRGVRWLHEFLYDARYALRTMWRTPGFTAIAVLTLALGIGANTAIFSLIHAAMLRSLPYPDGDRLVDIYREHRGEIGSPTHNSRKYLFFRENTRSFSEVAALRNLGNVNLIVAGEAHQVKVTLASANYFRTLRVEPALGRSFTPEEDSPGGADVGNAASGAVRRCSAAL